MLKILYQTLSLEVNLIQVLDLSRDSKWVPKQILHLTS